MRNPYHYQKTKHTRTRTPIRFSSYQAYKSDLRIEFAGQCVYCRALDSYKGFESFGVDHYRPKQKFPRLITEYSNLFYCCNRCNSLKRDFWPSTRDSREERFIPNPCDHVMFEHLRYLQGEVQPHSFAGAFTEEKLDLNDPDIVEFRSSLITMLAATNSQIDLAKTILEDAQAALDAAATEETRAIAREIYDQADKNLNKLQAAITQVLG